MGCSPLNASVVQAYLKQSYLKKRHLYKLSLLKEERALFPSYPFHLLNLIGGLNQVDDEID